MVLASDEEARLLRLVDENEVDGYVVIDRKAVSFIGSEKQRLDILFRDTNAGDGTRYVHLYRPNKDTNWDITRFSGPEPI